MVASNVGLVVDAADPGSASARGGLEHHGEAQGSGCLDGGVGTVERLAVPRHDPQPGALGNPLDGDPVAYAAQHLGVGAQERHAESGADGGGGRVLGRRCPSGPQRVDVGGGQGPGERVRTGTGDGDDRIGRPHDRIGSTGIVVQGDHVERSPAFVANLAGGAGEADRRLDRAEHRDPVEADRVVPVGAHRSAASSGARSSAVAAPGRATVS